MTALTARGFEVEPFAALLLGPVVLAADPDELLDATMDALVSCSLGQPPS